MGVIKHRSKEDKRTGGFIAATCMIAWCALLYLALTIDFPITVIYLER